MTIFPHRFPQTAAVFEAEVLKVGLFDVVRKRSEKVNEQLQNRQKIILQNGIAYLPL